MSHPDDPRMRLLDAAGTRFAEKGFDATNVREITELAGTNVAAVNYYFGSKEELYVATVRHAAQSCETTTPMPTWPPSTPPETRLRDFIRAFLQRLLRTDVPEWHRLLIMREVGEPRHGACEEFVRGYVRPTFEMLLEILGELTPPALPRRQLELMASSIVGQCLHYHHARHVLRLLLEHSAQEQPPLEVLTDHIARFSLSALQGLFPFPVRGART